MLSTQTLTSQNATAEIVDETTIELTFTRPGITLTKMEVMCGWNLAIQLDPERKRNILLITAPESLLNEAARIAAFEEKTKWPLVAMVVHNLGQTIMARMSMNKHCSAFNTKVFSTSEEARLWLSQKS